MLGCCAATQLLAQDEPARPHQKISANELRRTLASRFPIDFGVPGLFDVKLDVRDLSLLPASQRLGTTLVAKVFDVAKRQAVPGEMDVTFALRYEAADRTLRAHALNVSGLRSPALAPEDGQAWQALLDQLVRTTLAELILHRFSRAELQLPDTLGFRPDRITVEEDGVELWFAPKPPS